MTGSWTAPKLLPAAHVTSEERFTSYLHAWQVQCKFMVQFHATSHLSRHGPGAGVVANQTAGPAVCISFVVGGVCAMLSSFVYAEFATELPVAGSSFTYVLASLGQFPAFLVTANMVRGVRAGALPLRPALHALFPSCQAVGALSQHAVCGACRSWSTCCRSPPSRAAGQVRMPLHLLGAHALMQVWRCARTADEMFMTSSDELPPGLPGYLATLCNQDSDAWRIHVGWADLDPVAVGAIIVLTVLICMSTKESGRFNTVLVVTKLTGVVFVIVAGARGPSDCCKCSLAGARSRGGRVCVSHAAGVPLPGVHDHQARY